ncbi:MAG: hypothetical protein LBP72_02530 [Dysgonamonadaceae bacterium]|nr:hypothetical protein [Dysgonamonadaceae bacterium]
MQGKRQKVQGRVQGKRQKVQERQSRVSCTLYLIPCTSLIPCILFPVPFTFSLEPAVVCVCA